MGEAKVHAPVAFRVMYSTVTPKRYKGIPYWSVNRRLSGQAAGQKVDAGNWMPSPRGEFHAEMGSRFTRSIFAPTA